MNYVILVYVTETNIFCVAAKIFKSRDTIIYVKLIILCNLFLGPRFKEYVSRLSLPTRSKCFIGNTMLCDINTN
jgi:hypothetical protein